MGDGLGPPVEGIKQQVSVSDRARRRINAVWIRSTPHAVKFAELQYGAPAVAKSVRSYDSSVLTPATSADRSGVASVRWLHSALI